MWAYRLRWNNKAYWKRSVRRKRNAYVTCTFLWPLLYITYTKWIQYAINTHNVNNTCLALRTELNVCFLYANRLKTFFPSVTYMNIRVPLDLNVVSYELLASYPNLSFHSTTRYCTCTCIYWMHAQWVDCTLHMHLQCYLDCLLYINVRTKSIQVGVFLSYAC